MLPSVLVYGAMTLVAAFIAAYAHLPSLFALPAEGTAAGSLALGAGLALVVVLGGRFLERHAWYAAMGDALREPARALLGPKAGVPEALIVALSSSIGEESLFRGLCQPGLLQVLTNHTRLQGAGALAASVLLTAVSFTLLHPPWKRELRPWTVFAFFMAIAWGLLAAWSGSLAATVLSHFLVNFFNLRRLLRWPGPVARDPERC